MMHTTPQAFALRREEGKHQRVSLRGSATSGFPQQKTLLDVLAERERRARNRQELLCPFTTLARALAACVQQAQIPTPEWCVMLAERLSCVRQEVENHFTILEKPGSPCSAQDYPVLHHLHLLHRTLAEVFVLVKNVSGQCAHGCISRDPTNSYGQLCEYISIVQQSCQALGRLLQNRKVALE